jgi:hypothetical protein
MYLITHPKSRENIELLYMNFPMHYHYYNVSLDWYWTSKTEYDIYLENSIISENESQVLRKIGDVISSDDIDNRLNIYEEVLRELYFEFINGRTFSQVLFPDFIYLTVK